MPFDSPKSDLCGLTGRYLLLRMVEQYPLKGKDIFPYVYWSISPDIELPATAEAISKSIYIKTTFRDDYRIGLVAQSQDEFDSREFQYLGNFQQIQPPENEFVIPEEKLGLYGASTFLKEVVDTACERYSYFVLGKKLD